MSGFDDDFGGMVESGPPSGEVQDLLEPISVDQSETVVPETISHIPDDVIDTVVKDETDAGKIESDLTNQ